ncbi:MAG: sensor histidine kinase [Tepidiformaceae bacterium]
MAQEAMHNAVKHARAKVVDVSLRQVLGVLTLEVRDNGVVFDPGGDFPGHLGLRSMRERAAQIGGHLAIESAAGQGTLIRATLPIART